MAVKETLREKAKNSCGRSHCKMECPFFNNDRPACSIEVALVCRRAYIEGYEKGYKAKR